MVDGNIGLGDRGIFLVVLNVGINGINPIISSYSMVAIGTG
jgi:hypothetical protein